MTSKRASIKRAVRKVAAHNPTIEILGYTVEPPALISVGADGQLDIDPLMKLYAPSVRNGITAAFGMAKGFSGLKSDAGDIAECIADTWGMVWHWIQGHDIRTLPAPPRRPNGVSITKGVKFADVRSCGCEQRCRCDKDAPNSLERWCFKIAFSVADGYARARVQRDQTAARAKFKAAKERRDAGLLPDETTGTPTFPQNIRLGFKAKRSLGIMLYDYEPNPDESSESSTQAVPVVPAAQPSSLIFASTLKCPPDTVMWKEPGEVRDAARKKLWPDEPVTYAEAVTSAIEGWKGLSFPVRYATDEEWERVGKPYPVYAKENRTPGGFTPAPWALAGDDDEPTMDHSTWGPELVTLGQDHVDLPHLEMVSEDEESTENQQDAEEAA